ncbi:MAG: DUF2497 domain-containing protein [Phenylobacterium sp.]
MEEILASIRRIISEDDSGPEAKAEDLPIPPPLEDEAPAEVVSIDVPPEPEPEPAEAEEEVLELTERVESVGDLDVYPAEEPEPPAYQPEPEPVAAFEAPPPPDVGEGLVGAAAATAAAIEFGRLSSNIGLGNGDATLEQIVRELLRPLLKQWLDDNLPGIVQTAVDAEVERIARGRVR